METLPCWDKEKNALNLEILERDLLQFCLNGEIILENSKYTWKRCDVGTFRSALFSQYKGNAWRHSTLNTVILQLISSPCFQERLKILREHIEWLSAQAFWSPELLHFDYGKLFGVILKGIERSTEQKVFPTYKWQDVYVGPELIFEHVPNCLINFLYEEMNKAYPMTDFENKFWLKKKDEKEELYKRLWKISQFSKLPSWDKEKCEINFEKLEQDVLQYMVAKKINYHNNLFVSKDNFSKDFLAIYLTTNKEIQDLIYQIVKTASFQTKLAYLRQNIHWLSTNKHWQKETMCLDYDGLRADVIKSLEQFAQNGGTRVAINRQSNGDVTIGSICLFENVDSGEQYQDTHTEISKAFPFDYGLGWDWSQKK